MNGRYLILNPEEYSKDLEKLEKMLENVEVLLEDIKMLAKRALLSDNAKLNLEIVLKAEEALKYFEK